MRPPPLLDAGHVSVGFAGVAALANVSLALWPARVHALIGENGAGKSTLINVLTGVLEPDAGELRWRGVPVRLAAPQQAARLGISVVHQEPQLVATMTALDNLFIGERFPTVGRTPFVARAAMRRLANAAFERLGVALPLDAKVADLSATEKTLLALARCVLREPALLILDEPSAALTTHDAARLLQTLDRLRAGGTAVVYVSHRLDEVLRIADDITVLCNGSVVATLLAAGQTHASLVEAMSRGGAVGAQAPGRRELPSARPAAGARAASSTARPRLRLQNVHSRDGRVRGVSLDLHAGEIVGVYGLAGSGRTELLELLVGLRALAAGRVEDGMEADGPAQAPVRGSHDAAQRGRVLIPEDRRGHALVLRMRVRENLSLPLLRRFARFGLLSRRRERDAAVRAMRSLDVKARGPEQTIAELSGGNQQKVVFARALALQADVLLCDEPTQAVDVATRQAIHRLLRERVAAGGAVLLVTSDLAEMLELADRIVVLRAGAGVATLVNAALHPEDVLRWCFEPRRAEPPGEAAAADAKCAPPAPSPSPTPAGTVVPAGSAALGRRAP